MKLKDGAAPRPDVLLGPLTVHQRGYDAARIEYTTGVNANASRSFSEAQKLEPQTGDRMAAISTQQGREAARAAYAAAATSIVGHRAALEISNQVFRLTSAEG